MPLTSFAIDGFAFQVADPQELLPLLQSIPGVEMFQDTQQWWNVRTEEMCAMEQISGYEAILLPDGEEVHLDYEGRTNSVVCRWIKDERQRFFRQTPLEIFLPGKHTA